MGELRKITMFVPADLLATAQAETGAGITETVRLGLERLAREAWSRRMLALRGKGGPAGDISAEIAKLREDREFERDGTVL
jgi:hypothetical protein